MPCLHTRGPGQLHGPHPPCTRTAPTGQGSYTAHTHHAHGLRVQPSSAQGWTAGHIWCQAVTLTLPQLLPARGYLGRRRQPALTPCRTVLPKALGALPTMPTLSPVPYVMEDATSPGTKTLSQGHELGGRGRASRQMAQRWGLAPDHSAIPGLSSCLRPQAPGGSGLAAYFLRVPSLICETVSA